MSRPSSNSIGLSNLRGGTHSRRKKTRRHSWHAGAVPQPNLSIRITRRRMGRANGKSKHAKARAVTQSCLSHEAGACATLVEKRGSKVGVVTQSDLLTEPASEGARWTGYSGRIYRIRPRGMGK